MEQHRYNQQDPWENGVYETGSTKPPKNHRGLIAVLLVVVIFLGGLVSVLGVVNIRLFAQLNAQPTSQEDPLSFVNRDMAETRPTELEATMPQVTEAANQTPSFILNPSPEGVENVPQEGGLSLQDIYEKSIDSVVSITCQSRYGNSTGTGVILSEQGYLVTNSHVISGAEVITVRLTDERTFRADLIGQDEISDLAVLWIRADGLIPAEFGDSTVLRVGDNVAAIGDPLGSEFRGTLTNGIVSAINRDVTTGGRTLTLIQTDAALNSGNSGGPLINCYGQVIGINTMKIGAFTDQAGVEGIGFAIPSATVKEIVEQLIHQGYVSGRPAIGIEGEGLSSFYQYYYSLPAGLYISHVENGSGAAKQGIEPGDILLSLDGERIINSEDLRTLLYNYEAGDTVRIIIYRNREQVALNITLHESKS